MSDDPAYFLYHSIGQYPGKERDMAEALGDFAAQWAASDDGQWARTLAQRAEYLTLWRRLIDAPEGTLTSAENVTTALYSLIGALPPAYLRGKRVLVTADCFPSLHFLLAGLAERLGFTLDTVPLRDGEYWVREEDMIARWGADVGLALLTFVTSTASYRCDLGALAGHARAMGSLFGVDLTQGIGIVPFSLDDHQPDFVLSTSLKWLCGAPGGGMLQVRAGLIEECRPELRGWFSQDNPFSWDLDAFEYAEDARSFDHGTPSAIACIATVPVLKWHAGQNPDELLKHNRALSKQLIEGAEELGLELACPRTPERRGGSVMLCIPDDVDGDGVVGALRADNIFLDRRGSTLRLSPGVVTGADHVTRVLDSLRAICGKRFSISS